MRLRVIGYYHGEYMCTLSNQDILISFKEYTITKQSDIGLTAPKNIMYL